MAQFALTRNTNTRLWTQLTRSSIVASRRGMSRSSDAANAGRPNSIVAETRDSVTKGEGVSGLALGLSAANAGVARSMQISEARKRPLEDICVVLIMIFSVRTARRRLYSLSRGFDVADEAQNFGKLAAHGRLERVDLAVGGLDRRFRIDATVENAEIAAIGRAKTHVVDLAQASVFRRLTGKCVQEPARQLGIGVAPRQFARLQRFDMGFHFDVGAQFVFDRVFQLGRHLMRLAQTHPALDLEIERDAGAALDTLDCDVMDEQTPPARDHLHPLEHGFIVERERIGRDGELRRGPARRERRLDIRLDRGDALERQRARYEQPEIAYYVGAAAAKPQKVDARDARNRLDRVADLAGEALGRGVDQSVDGPPPQTKACDGDERRDADRGERIGADETRARRGEADQHQRRGDEVAREVQRVGRERIASRFRRDAPQRAPTHEIDDEREPDRRERERVGVDDRARLAEAPYRSEGDPG